MASDITWRQVYETAVEFLIQSGKYSKEMAEDKATWTDEAVVMQALSHGFQLLNARNLSSNR